MISIILPYYFGEKFIHRALNSCKAGIALGAEIIVVFDSPEDERSREIKSEIAARSGTHYPAVTMIQNEKNIGPASSRRVGLQCARHDIVILLDQDDELTEARFDPQSIEGADLILFEALRKGTLTEVREVHPPRYRQIGALPSHTFNQILATRRQPARIGAITIRKDCAERNLSTKDGGGEEWEFFVRVLSEKATIRYCHELGLIRHVHENNLSMTKGGDRLAMWISRVDQLRLPWIVKQIARRTIRKRFRAQAAQ